MYVLLSALLLLAQASSSTNLVITGAESAAFATSDTNGCYIDENNAVTAQLTDPSSDVVLSLQVPATLGDHPAKNLLTGLTLDGPGDNPIVNWSGASGTVTLDNLSAQVPFETGDASIAASTSGVVGHIDADMTSERGSFHVRGPFACHSPA